MNFGKLLGAGKTFFDGSRTAEYRLNKRISLPKFNAGKNPFMPKPVESAPAVAMEMKKVSVPVAAKTQKISTLPAARPARAGWTTRLNPFRAPEPAAPPMADAVQPEFSLDTVKVVH